MLLEATIPPIIGIIMVNKRNIQAYIESSTLKSAPIIKKIAENIIVVQIPQRSPQSIESLHLLFFTVINPPKKDAVSKEKAQSGIISLCGEAESRVIAENKIISAISISSDDKVPSKTGKIMPPFSFESFFECCFFLMIFSFAFDTDYYKYIGIKQKIFGKDKMVKKFT